MNARFREWVMKKHDQFDQQEKQDFLRMLKINPEKLLGIISSCVIGWTMIYSEETGKIVYSYDNKGDSRDILRALKDHYDKELIELPNKPSKGVS